MSRRKSTKEVDHMASLATQVGAGVGAFGDAVRAVKAIAFALVRTAESAAHRLVSGVIGVADTLESAAHDAFCGVLDETEKQTDGLIADVFGAKR
jgi:hypothetical protein